METATPQSSPLHDPPAETAFSKPFTPESLAERWSCSAEKVRQMVRRGELMAIRLGKLIRIPAIEVERFECLGPRPVNNMNSSPTVGSSLSRLDAEQAAAESRLARMTPA